MDHSPTAPLFPTAPLPTTALPLQQCLAAQKSAYLRDGAPDLAQRRARLDRLKAVLVENRAAIEAAVSADFSHRSVQETALLEVFATLQAIKYLHRRLPRLMRPNRRHVSLTMQPGKAWIEWQPKGVIGIISPWNYPLQLALVPLATALAAGNRVMLKPSELTPATSELMARLIAASFVPEEVSVVTGGAELAAEFSALPFDHLFFTGSTAVGRKVMRAAAENLTPVTLELGGKSPAIIAKGHLSDDTLRQLAFGKLINAGQTCVAPDYLLIHREDLPGLAQGLSAMVAQLYPLGPASPDYTAIINPAHFTRLTDALAEAEAAGATILPLGNRPEAATGRKLAPQLVLDLPPGTALAQHEIFGPILPVIPYDGLDQVIAHVNAQDRPLALYWFGPQDAGYERISRETTSGNIGVNNTLLHVGVDDLPFGGIGASGIGAYHGPEGFRSMSHGKGVFRLPGRWHPSRLMHPPYGAIIKRFLKLVLR